MIEIAAVSVGVPSVLATIGANRIWSGISKQPVSPTTPLWMSELNLSGDGQADLTLHGGFDKAVYVYPSEHLAAWSSELGEALGPAAFGENVTSVGALESDVRIGDLWSWGGALLQVTQPRWPCFKLALFRGRPDIQARLRASGRTGWYLRVVQPGEVTASRPIELVRQDPDNVTVADAHDVMSDVHLDELERAERVAMHPFLADQWREPIMERLERFDARATGNGTVVRPRDGSRRSRAG